MATSFKARVNKLKSTRVNVSQKSDKSAPETPLSNSMEEDTLKAWMHSTNNITNAITRIESDVNSVKSDRDRVIKLEVELEKLMQLISNKDYFKNIFMEMLESMEPEEEKEEKEEKEEEWKNYIDNELINLRGILNNTHSNISNSIEEINQNNSKKINFLEEKINKQEIVSELNNFKEVIDIQLKKYSSDLKMVVDGLDARLVTLKQDHKKDTSDMKGELTWINSRLNDLKQDHATMVTIQKNSKNDIEILEIFKNKQKKNNELIEENSDNLEKIKKENINIKNRIETIENITKETSTIFVTKVADLADHVKKLDKRSTKNENYSNELSKILESIKTMFEQEKNSLSKIISNLKDDFVDLHERCDNTLSTLYRNDTQHIIDKYVFELSQLNLMFESSKTMQRENNYFKCIGNLSNRLDKIEQKIT